MWAKHGSDIDSLCSLLIHYFMEGFTVHKHRNGNPEKGPVYSKQGDTSKMSLPTVEVQKVKAPKSDVYLNMTK